MLRLESVFQLGDDPERAAAQTVVGDVDAGDAAPGFLCAAASLLGGVDDLSELGDFAGEELVVDTGALAAEGAYPSTSETSIPCRSARLPSAVASKRGSYGSTRFSLPLDGGPVRSTATRPVLLLRIFGSPLTP